MNRELLDGKMGMGFMFQMEMGMNKVTEMGVI